MFFKYLPGINTLRFLAALFVIIGHGQISLTNMGIVDGSEIGFLNRGSDAVEFFFTLSGLLITYLLINEIKLTNTISIKAFYMRRLFRIWPLYFLLVIAGFLVLGLVYPYVYHKPYFDFPSMWVGLLMFICFLPNYAARNFSVGFLFPLWSIGVEEQFYLFWAPLVKRFQHRLLALILVFSIVSTVLFLLIYNDVWKVPEHLEGTLKFFKIHFMAIGCIFGYLLFYGYDQYTRSVFAKPISQLAIWFIVVYHYMVGFPFSDNVYFHVLLAGVYALLILNVSVLKNKVLDIEKKPFVYLGVISYGLYMYHMIVDYFLRIVYSKPFMAGLPKPVIIITYYVALVSITILIASLSYKYFETYFIKLKSKFSQI